MPNLSRDLKSGRSPDTSDLLSAMKRNTLLAVARSKDSAGKQKSLIKQQGFNTGFLDMNSKNGLDYYNAKGIIVAVSANGGLLGSFRVFGYSIGSITQADIDAFRIAFAAQFNLNPNLITITISPGSLIVTINAVPVSNVASLTDSDKSFFANSANIISGIQPQDISNVIAEAKIPPSSIYQNNALSIDPAFTIVNNSLDLKTLTTQDPTLIQKSYSNFPFAVVSDPINNCMYTLIPGQLKNSIVRINANGTIDRICDHVENNGCSHIFINAKSTHLIIPSNVEDTISPFAYKDYKPYCNKVYVVNILSRTIATIRLTDLNLNYLQGFDKVTERFYYTSAMASNSFKLCYVSIPSFSPDAIIPATYFTGIDLVDFTINNRGTIEFVDSTTAYAAGKYWISKFNLIGDGTKTLIAGVSSEFNVNGTALAYIGQWAGLDGYWSETAVGGPYVDSTNGTNAFFSSISSISYDSPNNRLLVLDSFALRIRSVDLTPGGNYQVTTLAGTSPTFSGLAINSQETTYTSGLLETFAQVGLWGNGINAMPKYTKINSSYLNSTFNFLESEPSCIVNFNNNIYVVGNEFRHLTSGSVRDFKTFFNTSVPTNPVTPESGGLIGTIKLNGYTLNNLSVDQTTSLNSTFAEEYDIKTGLVSINLSQPLAGPLVADFVASPTDFSKLSISDKSFFANADAVIRGIQASTFSSLLSKAKIPSSAITISASVSLDIASTIFNATLSIRIRCRNDSAYTSKVISSFSNPFVGDSINDCMYTIINDGTNNIVVRINKNGRMKKICNHLENRGCREIFINSDSTYLIIPSNVRDTTSPDSVDPNSLTTNKVYLVNISTGVITTITLTDLKAGGARGFDKATRRFYYSSFMSLNYRKLCYVTIPEDYSSAVLSATYFKNISGPSSGKIEFINSTNAFGSYVSGIEKLDLSTPNGSVSFVAGPQNRSQTGSWSSPVGGTWLNALAYGPFLDAPIGANAFFSFISDICYDSENNRLLVSDGASQRIRSVDLTPGNNYAVTTLAGTSPTTLGLAINNSLNLYSQSVLDTLAQVGLWGENTMPAYTKVLGSYLVSTFNYPRTLLFFNNKVYLNTNDGTKQLSNGVVSDFSIAYDENAVVPVRAKETFIGTFKINGYELGTMTPELISRFTIAFASEFNVDPNLLNITFSAGSLITDIYTNPVEDVSSLQTSDLTFLANSPNIINNITTKDVSRVVTKSALPSSAIQQTGPLSIEKSFTKVNTGTGIVASSISSPIYTRNVVNTFMYPLVADPINNCMYTLINPVREGRNNSIVKIDVSGNMTIICDYAENQGCEQIFINSDSTYLIIPSSLNDTTSPDGQQPSVKRPNKIYLVNIETGITNTIILTDLNANFAQGFNKVLNRYYYCAWSLSKYSKLCYVQIPSDYSSQTLSPVGYYFFSLDLPRKIVFDNSNDGYFAFINTIRKLYLNPKSDFASFSQLIAGRPDQTNGLWSTDQSSWYTYPYYGPYLDSSVGTYAYFSLIQDICVDTQNERLLVVDAGAQRIRSVDISQGSIYSVSTLAGDSPVKSGVAINSSTSSFTQEFLSTLLQVGTWGVGNMPTFTKVNGTYYDSTFNNLKNIVLLNNRIFVRTPIEIRQLLNDSVTDFGVVKVSSTSTILLDGATLATITFNGYSVGNISPSDINSITNAFAVTFNIDPILINASFSFGSPVFTLKSISSINSNLTITEKIFFANIDAIIRGIQSEDMANIISLAQLPVNVINISGNASINGEATYVNTGLNIVLSCQNDPEIQNNRIYSYYTPMVADVINDCIYTSENLIISGKSNNSIIKINKDGSVNKICDYISNYPIPQISINLDSTYLIIPKKEPYGSSILENKLELINISTGIFSTITLTTLPAIDGSYGFDMTTRRYYYCSKNDSKLCYVTIPADFSSATLSATFFNNISLNNSTGKIQFYNSTIAYVSDNINIRKLDLSVPNGSSTLIAGFDRTKVDGYWESFSGNQINEFNPELSLYWYTRAGIGAYLDAPIGTDAFFCAITDITIDIPNNRLLVIDSGCHRIRSVNLFGNTYAVTTLAGTSPVFKGLARNREPDGVNPGTTFPQSVLVNLGQVSRWGENNMPDYTSVNSSFLSSTFNSPSTIVLLNNKIYVVNTEGEPIKQLSNGGVSNFILVQNTADIEVFKYTNEIVPLATFAIDGYSVASLGGDKIDKFKVAFASEMGGVNPELLVVLIETNPFIINISVDYSKVIFNNLNDNDKSFFANSDAILNSVTPSTFTSIIAAAELFPGTIAKNSPTTTIAITIPNTTSTGESAYKLKNDCLTNYRKQKKVVKQFANPLVADSINKCMYTIVGFNVVKITNNGNVRTNASLPLNFLEGCKYIFINSTSTHLIIPYYDGNVDSTTKNTLIYLFELGSKNGEVYKITLNDIDASDTYGFNKLTNRLYYCSSLSHQTNPGEICFITISNYNRDSTLSASFNFSTLKRSTNDLTPKGKIEFVDSNTGYYKDYYGVRKIDFSSPGGAVSIIAGKKNYTGDRAGYWEISVDRKIDWNGGELYGPYLDGSGTNAFFSYIEDISYDSENNRLLIADFGAQRIRSIDLSGNTYQVTTLAGTSFIKTNVSGTDITNYSQVVLDSLQQVGSWNNGINAMPLFTKNNKTFLTSTFKHPVGIVNFNDKIYVKTLDTLPFDTIGSASDNIFNSITYCTIRQLCNNNVSDFTGIETNFSPQNTSALQISVSNLVSTFTDEANSQGFFTQLNTLLQTGSNSAINISNSNLITHYEKIANGKRKIPSNIFALSGTTINPSVIRDIITANNGTGFLIPSAYPISVGDSSYQSNSVTNKLTIVTNGVTETKNPGDTYRIGGFPLQFLGAGSPAISSLNVINESYLECDVFNGIITFYQKNRMVFYSAGDFAHGFSEENWPNIPVYKKNLSIEGGARSFIFPDNSRPTPGNKYKLTFNYRDLISNGTLTLYPTSIFIFYNIPMTSTIPLSNPTFPNGFVGRSASVEARPPRLFARLRQEEFIIDDGRGILVAEPQRNYLDTKIICENLDVYLAGGGVCRLIGGNAINQNPSYPPNSISITTTTPYTVRQLRDLGFINETGIYTDVYFEVSIYNPNFTFRSNSISLNYKRPIAREIKIDYINNQVVYNYDKFLDQPESDYTTLYANGEKIQELSGSGTQRQSLDVFNKKYATYRIYFTVTVTLNVNGVNGAIFQTQATSRPSEVCIYRPSDNIYYANNYYKQVIGQSITNGNVNIAKVGETFFRSNIVYNGASFLTQRKANIGPSFNYHFKGTSQNYPIPTMFRIDEIGLDGSISAYEYLTFRFDTITQVQNPYDINSFVLHVTPNQYEPTFPPPPRIKYSVPGNQIFFIQKLNIRYHIYLENEVTNRKVCLLMNPGLRNKNLYALCIIANNNYAVTPLDRFAQVKLENNNGDTQYGFLQNPSFDAVVIDIPKGVSFGVIVKQVNSLDSNGESKAIPYPEFWNEFSASGYVDNV